MRPETTTRSAMGSLLLTFVFSSCSSSNSSACHLGSFLLPLLFLLISLCTTPFRGPTANGVSVYYAGSEYFTSSFLVNLTVSCLFTRTSTPSAQRYAVFPPFHPSTHFHLPSGAGGIRHGISESGAPNDFSKFEDWLLVVNGRSASGGPAFRRSSPRAPQF